VMYATHFQPAPPIQHQPIISLTGPPIDQEASQQRRLLPAFVQDFSASLLLSPPRGRR
jgi:hypothetical protein